MTAEQNRLDEDRLGKTAWRKWGPYLSERQWGTVREDYSPDGHAWEYLPHDHARSRAYRWGEDGIAGISDDQQQLCFALALWNGKDPILKERLFGLTGPEGNHGEDVKEYYFYLDNLPTHSYMKYLYKYPQNAFPYTNLLEENSRRGRYDFEYELLDTGIFNEDRYYDVFVEYAKASPDDMLIRISVSNRGPENAILHLIPTLWFRNTWSWQSGQQKPLLSQEKKIVKAQHPQLGEKWLYCEDSSTLLFTENETNKKRLFGVPNDSPYVKDGINEYIVNGNKATVNPQNTGTKCAAYSFLKIEPGETKIIKLRLSSNGNISNPLGQEYDSLFLKRKAEADDFYRHISPFPFTEDMRNVQRQAFAGLLWNKQCYHYNVKRWLDGDPTFPPPPKSREEGRNHQWTHLDAYDVFSMPDKWEYPWFAAWDLAFHTIPLAIIDPEFAKQQLFTLTKAWFLHPNGQMPAYEWSFGDVNPPVHAWAAMRIYQIEHANYGRKDRPFLERMFQKLLLNFTWWVNRKDAGDRNIFEGGFLGLDNIGAFNRSLGPPSGGTLEQPDGTGWMGMYCLNLLDIALELAIENPVYEDMATKFFEHFVAIADAINDIGGQTQGLWDAENGFYYGILTMSDGSSIRVEGDTMVGLVPLFAVTTNYSKERNAFPKYRERFEWLVKNRPELLETVVDTSRLKTHGVLLISIADADRLKQVLKKVLDHNQLLSDHGVRSVSRIHAVKPLVLNLDGTQFRLDYEPAESTTAMFGGNSNWRGPVWFPMNYLFIESLQKFHYFLGDDFKVECPVGSGNFASLWDVSQDLSFRLIKIFLKDENGRRPVYGGIEKFQTDPHWRDYILFHEYFHGDNAAGLGASNQTGWTGLVAKMIQQYGKYHLQNRPAENIEKEEIDHA